MGQLNSRHGPRHNDVDLDVTSGAYRYPIRSGGPYFGSHFVLGLERFDIAQPESYIFGENSDLNFLNAKPVQFPYPMLPSSKPCKPLYCSVVIRRDSLKFVRPLNIANNDRTSTSGDESDDSVRYNIEFLFDCDCPCTITVYYYATEHFDNPNVIYTSKRPELTSRTYRYGVGAGQLFRPRDLAFQTSLHEMNQLHCDSASDVIPIVIHAVAEPVDPQASDTYTQSHALLASVDRSAEGQGFILKVLKQKQFVDGVCYTMQEVYGIENKHASVPLKQRADETMEESVDCPSDLDDSGENGGECIVCMSELRDTLILPCRHLCICSSCAETLRYKASNCPLCRSPFRVLLQIKAVRKRPYAENPGRESLPTQRYAFINDRTSSNRYELEPLMCALNGPSASGASAVSLPSLPSRSFVGGGATSSLSSSSSRRHHLTSSSQPTLAGGGGASTSALHRSQHRAPRPPPRRGHRRKKHAKVPPPIQEVLTPQTLTSKSCEKIEMAVRNRGPLNKDENFSAIEIPQALPSDFRDADVPSPSQAPVEEYDDATVEQLGSPVSCKHLTLCDNSPKNDECDEDEFAPHLSPGFTVTIDFDAEEEELRSISSQEDFDGNDTHPVYPTNSLNLHNNDASGPAENNLDDITIGYSSIGLLKKIDTDLCEDSIVSKNALTVAGDNETQEQQLQYTTLDETALSSISSASNSSSKPLLPTDKKTNMSNMV